MVIGQFNDSFPPVIDGVAQCGHKLLPLIKRERK